MEFDPSKYSSTSYDALGPAETVLEIAKKQLQDMGILSTSSLKIVDLGCGPGNCSAAIVKHFPNATILGLDIDPLMIEYATKNRPNSNCQYYVQDLNQKYDDWNKKIKQELTGTVDVIFSNYALQWIWDPSIIAESMKRLLKPKTGIVSVNILYGDIMAVLNENEKEIVRKYMKFPDERKFMGDWIFALKNQGEFHNIWFQYLKPRSIYPERYYKESFVKIPLKWHENYIINPESLDDKILNDLRNLLRDAILRKRIKKIIPRTTIKNGQMNDDNFDEHEMNDIEIEQELWILIVRPN